MHFEKYFGKKKIDQITFNKKLNWFFDIKSIIYKNYTKKKVKILAKELVANFQDLQKKNKKKKFNYYKKKVVRLKNIDFKKLNKIDGGAKVKEIVSSLKNNDILNYFDQFIIQGSVASYDLIKNWSDFDTLVIIKNTILVDEIKLLKLRLKLKKLYKLILKFSKFQHHGLIIYTNLDLENYLPGYFPPQALKYNFSLKKDKIIFYISKHSKKNISKNILNDKKLFLKKVLKNRSYNHHVIGKKIPKIPFSNNDPFMFELFYNFGSILNIPILYLDAIGKSSHKKTSFKKFYKQINNNFVIEFIKKHEKIRKNWSKFDNKKFKIPNNLLDELGKNYFQNCLKVFQIVCKKIN